MHCNQKLNKNFDSFIISKLANWITDFHTNILFSFKFTHYKIYFISQINLDICQFASRASKLASMQIGQNKFFIWWEKI